MTSRAPAAAAMLLAATTVAGAALLDGQPARPAPAPAPLPAPPPPDRQALEAVVAQAVAEAQTVDRDAIARRVEEAMRQADVEGTLARARVHLAQTLRAGTPRLGVTVRDVTADEAAAAGLEGIEGAWLTSVAPTSAAATAGLLPGDILVRLDGLAVRSARHLSRIVLESPAGRVLPVEYVRGGQRGEVSVMPDTPQVRVRPRRDPSP